MLAVMLCKACDWALTSLAWATSIWTKFVRLKKIMATITTVAVQAPENTLTTILHRISFLSATKGGTRPKQTQQKKSCKLIFLIPRGYLRCRNSAAAI